jgi:hypothetical protein
MSDLKQPRPPRHSIRADAQICDSVSGRVIDAETPDVSLGGCYVETSNPLDAKSTVRIQISYNGSTVSTYGDVVRSDKGKGMGLKFRGIAPEQVAVIKRWLFALDRPDY